MYNVYLLVYFLTSLFVQVYGSQCSRKHTINTKQKLLVVNLNSKLCIIAAKITRICLGTLPFIFWPNYGHVLSLLGYDLFGNFSFIFWPNYGNVLSLLGYDLFENSFLHIIARLWPCDVSARLCLVKLNCILVVILLDVSLRMMKIMLDNDENYACRTPFCT